MARASSDSAIDDGLTRCLWRARPDGCRPDAALFARTAQSLDARASFGLGMNAADALADAAKKVAAYEAETRRRQEQRRKTDRARADRFKAPPPPNTSQRGLRGTTMRQRDAGEDVDSLAVVDVAVVEPEGRAAARAKRDSKRAERDAKLAKAKAAAAAKATATYEAARDRLREEGPDPVTKACGKVAPTMEDMISKVDARVDGGHTSATKGAEWLDGMRKDATFWAEVNRRCRPQENIKKKGGLIAGGKRLGSQKGQAAAKKARKA